MRTIDRRLDRLEAAAALAPADTAAAARAAVEAILDRIEAGDYDPAPAPTTPSSETHDRLLAILDAIPYRGTETPL